MRMHGGGRDSREEVKNRRTGYGMTADTTHMQKGVVKKENSKRKNAVVNVGLLQYE